MTKHFDRPAKEIPFTGLKKHFSRALKCKPDDLELHTISRIQLSCEGVIVNFR